MPDADGNRAAWQVLAVSPQRVLFGRGTLAELPSEVRHLGLSRVLVVSTPGQAGGARTIANDLGAAAAAVFDRARVHTPAEVTDAAMAVVSQSHVDGLVAIGGGSAIGLAKAIALRTELPQIVVPTTYAGSEATPVLGETRDGIKKTVRDRRILPKIIVYDVALTSALPARVSMLSGMNALAHAVEALYAKDATPLIRLLAEEGLYKVGRALPAIATNPADRDARSEALYGAWLCGRALGATTMGLHHRLCHVLGGAFDVPHAATHSILLPHVAAYNRDAAPEAMATAARALDAGDAIERLFELGSLAGAPTALRDIGVPEDGLDRIAGTVAADPPPNPRPIVEDDVRALLERAWSGTR